MQHTHEWAMTSIASNTRVPEGLMLRTRSHKEAPPTWLCQCGSFAPNSKPLSCAYGSYSLANVYMIMALRFKSPLFSCENELKRLGHLANDQRLCQPMSTISID